MCSNAIGLIAMEFTSFFVRTLVPVPNRSFKDYNADHTFVKFYIILYNPIGSLCTEYVSAFAAFHTLPAGRYSS